MLRPGRSDGYGHRGGGWLPLLLTAALASCSAPEVAPDGTEPAVGPSILFVTLDTTRADRLGFDSGSFETPSLDALAARGVVFEQAYSTVPMTLPAHVSMFTGRYPAEHGIHENGRYVPEGAGLLAPQLTDRGYLTMAAVSGFPLSRQFGLARGFALFDDTFPGGAVERDAAATTDRALALLDQRSDAPLFLWVHYFDPHEPYAPPEPYASRFPDDPYQGEIAFMDRELGRLIAGFDEAVGGDWRIIVVGDHGEGLGEHGETLHGRLLYQGVMRVPLLVAGSGIAPGRVEAPVSTRQAFDTVLGWADGARDSGWLAGGEQPVLGEALKPFLQYGWQPQVMGVSGRHKVIRSGRLEVYDIASDPGEVSDLAGEVEVDRQLLEALRDYPLSPVSGGDEAVPEEERLSEEAIRKLASLGYFDSGPGRGLRENAPSPREMTHLFRDLDLGSALFVRQEYARAIPVFSRVLEADPENLVVALRLAVAHSLLGRERQAEAYFERARKISPASVDLRHYHAMHYLRFGKWDEAAPLFESVLAESPGRLPALEGLARIRKRQGRLDEARRYQKRVVAVTDEPAAALIELGELSMALQDTAAAVEAFERARDIQGEEFTHHLELGVCHLDLGRYAQAAYALDQVPESHPGFPLALFKRAQVAVLLQEADWRTRVRRAMEHANEMTRQLIEQESLFGGYAGR